MAVMRFTQDPEAPEGAGTFELDDGRQIYAHDPELARQVSQPAEPPADLVGPQQDMRVAGPGGAPEGMSPQQRAEFGMMGQDEARAQLAQMNFGAPQADIEAVKARQAAAQPVVKGPAAPPKDVIEPGATVGGGPSEFDRNVSGYVQAQARRQGAPRAEAWIPKSRAETVETEGVPYNPEDAAVRIAANRQVMEAKAATADLLRTRAVNEAASAKAAQPELLSRAADAQKALDAQHAAYQQDRAELQRAIDTSNRAQGGASEWFASKSTVAQLGMVLGQAFGAYAATLSGGQNWAQQSLQNIMEHDIAAQKEGAKRGVDNAFRRLELRYKDQDQAEAALRLAQGNILTNIQNMHASANQAEDVQAAHQEMLAQNQAGMVAQEQKFQNAAYGKHTSKLDVAHQAAGGGGGPDVAAIAKQLKAAGLTDEQIRTAIFGKGGGGHAGDAISRENVATIHGKQFEFDRKEDAVKAQDKAAELDRVSTRAERLKAILASPTISPTMRSEAAEIARELALGYGPMFSGSTRINEREIEAGQQALGELHDSLLSGATTDILGRKRAGIDTILTHVGRARDDLMEGGVKVNRTLGTNERGQRERQYTYQTAPRTLEEVE